MNRDIGRRNRHPDNRFGQGTNEFYQAEYKLNNVSREEYWEAWKNNAPKCPSCGAIAGMSWGTGDCGCDGDGDY